MKKKYISNQDFSVRMFKNSYQEMLTKAHPALPLMIFLPVIAYLITQTMLKYHLTGWQTFKYTLLGLFIWAITEYVMHRFVFHFPVIGPKTERIYFIFHGVHHDYPRDSMRLVMPPSVSIPGSYAFFLLFTFLAPDKYAFPSFAGFMVGYLCYDMTHFAIHHFPMAGPVGQRIRNHHFKHHYHDSKSNFGVSSPLWDIVFNSVCKKKQDTTPETLAPESEAMESGAG